MSNFNVDNNAVIGFDMDGVIIDHTQNKLALAKQFGFSLKPDQTPSSIIRTVIPSLELAKLQKILYDDPQLALSPPLMNGAESTLAEIKTTGIPFYLISRRMDLHIARELLKKRNLWPKYFNDKNAFFVDRPEDKNIMAARLGITHFVDDELEVLAKLSRVDHRFLFDPLHVFDSADYYHKINSWTELRGLFFG